MEERKGEDLNWMKDGHDLKEDRESDVVPLQEHFPWGDTNKPALFLYRERVPQSSTWGKKEFLHPLY